MYSRLIKPRILEAQQDTPVTLLAGPRQAGKTTLVKQISLEQGMKYMTLNALPLLLMVLYLTRLISTYTFYLRLLGRAAVNRLFLYLAFDMWPSTACSYDESL